MASNPPGGGSILPEGWTWGDVGHGALDIAGLIPGWGEGADAANAAWYANEAKYLEAGLSLISCVPVVGDIIGKGGKLASKMGGPALRKLVPILKNMDFAKALAPFRSNPKLGPHIDKMVEALGKWRDDLVAKARGVQPCPNATKALGEKAAMIGKTPVPSRILDKLTDEQLAIFKDAVARVEDMPLPRPGKAVFYSGKVGDTFAWQAAEASAKTGKFDSVNTLTKDLLNAGNIRKSLPRDAMEFVDNLASKRLADTAEGVVKIFGEVETINPNSVFRRIELPALLDNPKVAESTKETLRNMKYFLDAKYGK